MSDPQVAAAFGALFEGMPDISVWAGIGLGFVLEQIPNSFMFGIENCPKTRRFCEMRSYTELEFALEYTMKTSPKLFQFGGCVYC